MSGERRVCRQGLCDSNVTMTNDQNHQWSGSLTTMILTIVRPTLEYSRLPKAGGALGPVEDLVHVFSPVPCTGRGEGQFCEEEDDHDVEKDKQDEMNEKDGELIALSYSIYQYLDFHSFSFHNKAKRTWQGNLLMGRAMRWKTRMIRRIKRIRRIWKMIRMRRMWKGTKRG